MNRDQYPLIKDLTGRFYEFESVGPKGNIKKIVQFHRIKGFPSTVFNLSFGDWNELTGKVDDSIASNNYDRDKALATVATTVVEFTAKNPDAVILAEGSTPARTGLYQMNIAKFLNAIERDFILKGLRNSQWERFCVGVNYECFLLKRR